MSGRRCVQAHGASTDRTCVGVVCVTRRGLLCLLLPCKRVPDSIPVRGFCGIWYYYLGLTPACLSQACSVVGQAPASWVQVDLETRSNCSVCSGGPIPPRWTEPASPCHRKRGRQMKRRLVSEGKAGSGASRLRPAPLCPPCPPQGYLWTSASTTCTCQRSSSRPFSGSSLSPCSPLTSTPTWLASSVSALFPPQLRAASAASGLDSEQAALASPPRKVCLGSPL